MTWNRILAGATCIGLGLLLCNMAYESMAALPESESISTPPSIESIRELSELTILAVEAMAVVSTEVSGYTGCTSVAMLVQGTVTLAVDLDRARFVQVDQQRKHLLLALPRPSVRRVSIDPHQTRVLHCERRGLWRLAVGTALEDRALAEAMAVGHDRLKGAGLQVERIQRARDHAQAVLRRFITEMGWTLDIHWGDENSPAAGLSGAYAPPDRLFFLAISGFEAA